MNPLVQVMALIQTLYFNTLNAGLFFRGNKNTLPFPFVSWHWDGSSDWNPSSWKTSTVQCCYNTVNFLQIPHNRHPIAQPWGWGMGCLLWIQILIYVLPQWLEYCHVVLDHVTDTAKTFGFLPDRGGILAWFCWYQTWLYTGVLPVLLIFYQQMSKDRLVSLCLTL